MKTYTSKEILERDDLYDIHEMDNIQYELTEGELNWLYFVRGKYSIADYLLDTLDENRVVTLDTLELSQALDDDCQGFGKGVCLSDDTALQKLFFWLYTETEQDETT